MSRKRTRGVRTLPLNDLELLHHPNVSKEHKCFGEEIDFGISDNEDSLDLLLEIRDLGTGKSSSSSLSWGEEYKSEAGKQVKDELERMDRVLRGQEPIPSHYDQEEYQEWMQFFPNFCVKGSTMKKHHTPSTSYSGDYEEVFAVHPEETTPRPRSKREIAHKIPVKIIKKPELQPSPKSINIDSYLKIYPLKRKDIVQRQQSSRSLISSHISSSKWLKDDDDFNSLPFLVDNLHIKHSKLDARQVKPPKGILKNATSGSLVLPPIQQRSVSATPRRSGQQRSVLSSNQSGRDRKSTPRLLLNQSNKRMTRKLNVEHLYE